MAFAKYVYPGKESADIGRVADINDDKLNFETLAYIDSVA